MSGVTYRIPGLDARPPMPVDLGWYGDVLFDPDDSLPNYIGQNTVDGAATSAQTWKIYQFTYSSGNVTRIRLAYGSWDNRASLFP